ncbi:hypothetical protein CHUAL_009411 [Chamberlinius hualienensis]
MNPSLNFFILILELVVLSRQSITSIAVSSELRTNLTNGLELKPSNNHFSNNTDIFDGNRKESSDKDHNREPLKNQLKTSCVCLNGGTCITRFLCLCPNQFKGRKCESIVGNRPCGNRQHGDVYRDRNCGLCHCFDGAETCDNEITCGK